QILRDKAAQMADGFSHAFAIGRENFAQVLRIEARRQRRRPDQVGEHYRYLSALGGIWKGQFGRRGPLETVGDGVARQRRDGVEQLAAVADDNDPDVLEILRGQARQQRFVDVVFTKCRFILLKTEAQQ